MKAIGHLLSGNRLPVWTFCCVLSVLGTPSIGIPQDREFIQGLRERRLFQLAITHCESRLSDQSLEHPEVVDLTVELMQTHAAMAMQLSGEERTTSFADALLVADQFLEQYDDQPRFILVQVQRGLIQSLHGQSLQLELEVGIGTESEREAALNQLRASIAAFEQIDGFLELEIPKRFRRTEDQELSADQLLALRQRIGLQRGIAIRHRALLFERDDRLNRIDSLTQVVMICEELANGIPQENPLWWQVQLERGACLRLLGRANATLQLLNALPEEVPNAELQSEILALRVRALVDNDQPQEAINESAKWLEENDAETVELDEAILTALLALAGDPDTDERIRARIHEESVTLARQIEQKFGPFYGRRANLQLVGASSTGTQIQNLTILMQLGDEHYLKEEWNEALVAYQQTMVAAGEQQNANVYFEAGRKAGLLLAQLQRTNEASSMLQQISVEQSQLTDAPVTHLQAAWMLGQIASEDSSKMDDYMTLLSEHIDTWPESESTPQAQVWLARAHEFKQDHRSAFEIYLNVTNDSGLAETAIQNAMRSADAVIASTEPSSDERASIAAELALRFDTWLPENVNDPDEWSVGAAWACLASSRLRILHRPQDLELADQHLQASLSSNTDPDGAWRMEAMALRVVSLATSRTADAQIEELLRNADPSTKIRLIESVETLRTMAIQANGTTQLQFASAALRVTERLFDLQNLEDSERLRLSRLKASLLAVSGNADEAITLYEELLTANPRNGALLEELARFLIQSDESEHLEQALTRWRQLGRGSRPQSDRWFRAKYNVGLALKKLGRTDEAAQVLRYLKETPPGWEQSSLATQFERLLAECER